MEWKLAFTAFTLLFLAELGDKTQMAVFTLVAQNKQPIPIFIGASIALILVTFLGVFFGHLVTKFIPADFLQFISGALFLIIGIVILIGAVPNIITRFFG